MALTLKLTDRFQDRGTITGYSLILIYLDHLYNESSTREGILTAIEYIEQDKISEAAAILNIYQLTLEEV